MFPRYLFLLLDRESEAWRKAQYAKGVNRLLGAEAGKPSPLRPGTIEELRARCGEDGTMTVDRRVYVKPGDSIRITNGPFKSFEGVCFKSAKDRVSVMLSLFGRPNPITLRLSEVALVA
jgi:transcriptional antiterminator NusG